MGWGSPYSSSTITFPDLPSFAGSVVHPYSCGFPLQVQNEPQRESARICLEPST